MAQVLLQGPIGLFSTFPAQWAITAGVEHFCYPVRMMFALHLDSSSGKEPISTDIIFSVLGIKEDKEIVKK